MLWDSQNVLADPYLAAIGSRSIACIVAMVMRPCETIVYFKLGTGLALLPWCLFVVNNDMSNNVR